MAFLISENKNHDKNSAAKSSVGFLSWLKKINRWFKRQQSTVHAKQVKHDINRLEKERAREHEALLKQRKFYEHLIRRDNDYKPRPVLEDIKPEPKLDIKPEPKLEIESKPIPELKLESEIKPKSEPEIKPKPEPELEIDLEAKLEPEIKIEPELKPENIKPEPKVETAVKPVKKQLGFFGNFSKKISSKISQSSLAEKLSREREAEEAVREKNEVEERFWQAYNGVKANLVKDQGVLFFNWHQKLLTLALSLILCCLAIGLVYVGLLVWEKERLNNNQSTIANYDAINTEVAKSEKEIQEIVEFNHKLDLVSFILNNHIYWTNYLSFLEGNTLKDVYFEKFSGDLSGKYSVPAVARNLDAISLQLEVMKAYPMMRNIQYTAAQTIGGKAGTPSNVKFNLEMSLDPKIFIK